MVDPIEIKLDEMDAKIDQIAYAPKYKPTYEIDEMTKTKPPAGVLDQAIEHLTGGSRIGGALAAGGAAGLTAGVVIALTDAITDATKHSKILSTFMDTVGNALGLLVDLILLPFLPLLVWGMLSLYSAITGFGKDWGDAWNTLKTEGLIGLIKLKLGDLLEGLENWYQNFIKWLFGSETPGNKIVDIVFGIKSLLGGIFAFLSEKLIAAVIDFLFGQGSYNKGKQIVMDIIASLIDGGVKIIVGILEYIFGTTKTKNAIDFVVNLLKSGLELVWSVVDFILGGLNPSKLKIDLMINLVQGAGGILWSLVTGALGAVSTAANFVGGLIDQGGKMLGFAEGGTVPGPVGQPQVVTVHGGETITPPGQSQGNTYNLYFYGLTNDQLPDKIREVLRQEGARYHL